MREGTKVTVTRKVIRHGTSMAVVIPAPLEPELGEELEITIHKPVSKKKE